MVQKYVPKVMFLDGVDLTDTPCFTGNLSGPPEFELHANLQVYGIRIMAVPKPKGRRVNKQVRENVLKG